MTAARGVTKTKQLATRQAARAKVATGAGRSVGSAPLVASVMEEARSGARSPRWREDGSM